MTATSSDDGRPELYRLAGYGRWRGTDPRGVNDRLVYLSERIQSAEDTNGSEKAATVRAPSASNAIDHRQQALSELRYADAQSGRTALHIMCYWRPAPQLIDKFLTMATPELVWARTDAGETALHMACSNATRMAGAATVELLLNAAAAVMPSSSLDGVDGRREYALITKNCGKTALHCAAQADAPLSLLRVLLDAAPEAANIMDCSVGGNNTNADRESGVACTGRTPLDLLTKSYELFISIYLDCSNRDDSEAVVEESDAEAARQPSDTSDAGEPFWTESLRHFLDKAVLLIQASARHCRRRRINGTRTSQLRCITSPILHATLITAASMPFPPLLLRLITNRFLQQATEIDTHGNYPLHYAAGALSSGHIDPGIVHTILQEHQAAARSYNEDGLLPLQLLMLPLVTIREDCALRIDEVIRDLVRAYPPALFFCGSFPAKLLPRVLDKLGRRNAPTDDNVEGLSHAGGILLSNVYELLRSKPELLAE